MKSLLLVLFVVAAGIAGFAIPEPEAPYCDADGKAPGILCSYNGQTCLMLHPDLCSTEEPLPNCCNASPLSADRTAKECHCCAAQK